MARHRLDGVGVARIDDVGGAELPRASRFIATYRGDDARRAAMRAP